MATVDLGKISFVNKGTYDASTTYEERDVVQFTDGALSSYVYINATPASGQTPSTGGTVNSSHWSLFAGGVSLAVGNNKIVTTDGSGNVSSLAIGSTDTFLKVTGTNTLGFGAVTAPTEFKVSTAFTSSTATYTGTQSSYTDHITQSITTTIVAPVICHADFTHSYESGDVNMEGRFLLTPSSGSDIVGNPQQIAVYGFGSNRAMGSHNMMTAFQDVPAGSYTVKLQMRNDGGSGSQGQLNYFYGGGGVGNDRIYILYK